MLKNGRENASNVAGNKPIASFYCTCSQCYCRNFLHMIYSQELALSR